MRNAPITKAGNIAFALTLILVSGL
jgi:hypothetical protein